MAKRTRSQIGRLSRTKGATFERKIANELKVYFPDARRQPQSQIKQLKAIMGKDESLRLCLSDVVAGPFGIECKHRVVLPHIEDTLQQAIEDCGTSDKIPVAVHQPSPGGMYDRQVLMLYFGQLLRMGWVEFLGHCDRISKSNPPENSQK
jgi:hypothetical protein